MQAINSRQIKTLWAISKSLGMDKEDLYGFAAVDRLHDLDYKAANTVIRRLNALKSPAKTSKSKKHAAVPGMVSEAQQKKVWALMYQLAALNDKHADKSVGERLCGVIKKELEIEAKPENPFLWIDAAGGNKLVEALKRYVRCAKRERR